jgi:hypothetical protein
MVFMGYSNVDPPLPFVNVSEDGSIARKSVQSKANTTSFVITNLMLHLWALAASSIKIDDESFLRIPKTVDTVSVPVTTFDNRYDFCHELNICEFLKPIVNVNVRLVV